MGNLNFHCYCHSLYKYTARKHTNCYLPRDATSLVCSLLHTYVTHYLCNLGEGLCSMQLDCSVVYNIDGKHLASIYPLSFSCSIVFHASLITVYWTIQLL